MKQNISRRSFLKAAAAGFAMAAGLGITGAAAHAAEAGTDAKANWRIPPAPIPEAHIKEVLDFDIVVAGGGVAGIVAAATAVEAGAKTVMLAKSIGGVGAHWIGAVNSKAQQAAGMEFDRDVIINDLMWHASYRADQRLIRLWFDQSGEMVDWYSDILYRDGTMSVILEEEEKDTGGLHISPRTPHVPILGARKVMGVNETGLWHSNEIIRNHAMALGLDYREPYCAEQLIQEEDGSISGLIARNMDTEEYVLFRAAKGVILATGGYIANDEMREDLNPIQNATSIAATPVAPHNTGDGIRMATWCGAAMSDLHWWMDSDRASPRGSGWRPGSQPWLRVNCYGERFCNEDVPYDFGAYAGSLNPGHMWWDLFDADYYAHMDSFETTICSRMTPRPGGVNSEEVTHSAEEFYTRYIEPFFGNGMVVADTLEGLAAAMAEYDGRMDAENLKATVARYNELAHKGHDDDFGKMAKRLLPLENGPFYAMWQTGSSICNLDGLRINTNCEVIGADGLPLGKLYAAGNDAGGFYGMSYPWYYGGLNCGKGMVFARVAAKHACAK